MLVLVWWCGDSGDDAPGRIHSPIPPTSTGRRGEYKAQAALGPTVLGLPIPCADFHWRSNQGWPRISPFASGPHTHTRTHTLAPTHIMLSAPRAEGIAPSSPGLGDDSHLKRGGGRVPPAASKALKRVARRREGRRGSRPEGFLHHTPPPALHTHLLDAEPHRPHPSCAQLTSRRAAGPNPRVRASTRLGAGRRPGLAGRIIAGAPRTPKPAKPAEGKGPVAASIAHGQARNTHRVNIERPWIARRSHQRDAAPALL